MYLLVSREVHVRRRRCGNYPSGKECICVYEEQRSGIHKKKRRDCYGNHIIDLYLHWVLWCNSTVWTKLVCAYIRMVIEDKESWPDRWLAWLKLRIRA